MAEPELPCDELDPTPNGRALVVTDDENCQNELIQESASNYPAIAVAYSDDKVVLADGSTDFPFPLPNLQVQAGGSFSRLMVQDTDGIWYVYIPDTTCINQKMLVVDGQFTFEDDVLPELVTADICEISACDEFDFLLGAREVTIPCEPDDLTYLEMVKVPKALCPTCEEEEEV